MKDGVRLFLPVIVLLCSIAGLTSCRDAGHPSVRRSDEKAVRAALVRAEALMESDPHAARALLDSIAYPHPLPKGKAYPQPLPKGNGVASGGNQSPLLKEGTGEAAYYAWLRTQIDYKCDVPLTSDSLARIATDYYGTPRRPDYHAAMAWYTLGCVYKEIDDDINGTDAFLKAKSLFPDTLIRYYALAEQNLGIHYLNRHMTREAAHEFQSSKQNLIRLGDSTTVAFLDLSLARCCLYREDYASAKEWLERVLRNPHASQYVFTVAHFEMAKVETYFTHDYAKALGYIDYDIRHTTNKKELAGTYSLKATTLQKQGSLDSAWHYYHRSLECQSRITTFAYVYRQMAILAPQLGKADSIAYYVRGYHTYIDSLYIISNQQAIRQVMNDHRVEMEQQRLEENHRRILYIVVVFVLVTLLFLLFTENRHKKRLFALQYAIRQSNIELMNKTTQPEESDTVLFSSEAIADPDTYAKLFHLGKKLFPTKLLDNLERLKVISGGEESERICQDYLSAVDNAFVELMMLLRTACPSLNKKELVYIISRMLRIDEGLIRIIQGSSKSAFRTRKTRIKEKLSNEFAEKLFFVE